MSQANPVTILELAAAVLGRNPENGQDFADAQLQMLGGCEACGSSIAAYNAYPSKTGNWRCGDCIGDLGYMTIADARRGVFPDFSDASITLDHRERATVLAALLYWKQMIVEKGQPIPDDINDFPAGTAPLGSSEIATLCARINLADKELWCVECGETTAHEHCDDKYICRRCGNDYDEDDARADQEDREQQVH